MVAVCSPSRKLVKSSLLRSWYRTIINCQQCERWPWHGEDVSLPPLLRVTEACQLAVRTPWAILWLAIPEIHTIFDDIKYHKWACKFCQSPPHVMNSSSNIEQRIRPITTLWSTQYPAYYILPSFFSRLSQDKVRYRGGKPVPVTQMYPQTFQKDPDHLRWKKSKITRNRSSPVLKTAAYIYCDNI